MKPRLVVLSVVLASACTPESASSPDESVGAVPIGSVPAHVEQGSCTGSGNHDLEEELYGCVFNDDAEIGEWVVTLEAVTGTVWSPGYGVGQDVNRTMSLSEGYTNAQAQWGWYGFPTGFGGDCGSTQATNDPETHGGGGLERHCAGASPFMLRLQKGSTVLSLPIDFATYGNTAYGQGITVRVEGGVQVTDLVVHHDVTPDGTRPAAAVDVSVGNLTSPWVAPTGPDTVHVPSNMYLRIGAWSSQDHWNVSTNNSNGRLLVRYYWNWGVDQTAVTGLGAVRANGEPLARAMQLGSGGYRQVAAVVREPTGEVDTAIVMVFAAGPLQALPTVSPSSAGAGVTYVPKNTTITFGANATNDAQAYQWSVDGVVVRPWNASAPYQTSFGTNGNRTVKLEVRNPSGVVAETSFTINVYTPLTSVSFEGDGFPPGGPLRTNETCAWNAQATGGAPPLSWSWQTAPGWKGPWTEVGTVPGWIALGVGSSDFHLRLRVTDATQTTVTASAVFYAVTSTGIACVL